MSSSSEYGDEVEWTSSLLEELDRQQAATDIKPADTLIPDTAVEEDRFVSQDVLDDAALQAELLGEEVFKDTRSLLERFRKKGSLSVTDFCSPSVRSTSSPRIHELMLASVLRNQVLLLFTRKKGS